MYTILGSGLAGLSASYHIGHNNCVLYDKNNYVGGHIHSDFINGFTWDEGPHVSFTEHEYVKNLFDESVKGEFLEYSVKTINYYKGNWIPHPAQSNLFAVPQPLRDNCLNDFLGARSFYTEDFSPENYREWLDYSFGNRFADTFPAAYTRKYWTVTPELLTTDWVGNRMFSPKVEQVKEGYYGPLNEETHYIKKVRYPLNGGYMAYAKKLLAYANINLGYNLSSINFGTRKIEFLNDKHIYYDKLISTLPLPLLIERSNAPIEVKKAAELLNCTSVLLVNVTANHETVRTENWIYIYDENKYSTRINCTELLSPNNAPIGKTGVQVEVYFSSYKKKTETDTEISLKVIDELIEMGLIQSKDNIESYHSKWITWANVIFDHKRIEAQNTILNYLETHGLVREEDDLLPMTNWQEKMSHNQKFGDIILAGRFGQWKYYWTDDCVLRGKLIKDNIQK
ncbi:FAD-dependent oxidoreductase [Mucilaginibacter sp.]|uniref:protoporphyrinogen/coproporphyrinogen oxidase n=1 Tax=Mucilaginibacter sp. TaxID=1882438 RepID=UPI002845810C|nr:FAD-dependent oxidoreductase [Mucilaginibacter sp.]MDR3696335.1 FAD-dependent oxidoreductase [Mucilaginibacter sp.]